MLVFKFVHTSYFVEIVSSIFFVPCKIKILSKVNSKMCQIIFIILKLESTYNNSLFSVTREHKIPIEHDSGSWTLLENRTVQKIIFGHKHDNEFQSVSNDWYKCNEWMNKTDFKLFNFTILYIYILLSQYEILVFKCSFWSTTTNPLCVNLREGNFVINHCYWYAYTSSETFWRLVYLRKQSKLDLQA